MKKRKCLKIPQRIAEVGKRLIRKERVTASSEKIQIAATCTEPKQDSAGMRIRNISGLEHGFCAGCGACANICPTHAISLLRDSEGYLDATLDEQKCVNCGKCANVCPVISPSYDNRPEPDCYAVMANDEIRRVSSSGGAFTLLAEYVLKQSGCVCGAAFDSEFAVRHIIIEDQDELERLRGSKYVQSNTGNTFSQIKELLKAGRLVLFSGTPCQVAGLKGYLGKKYSNLVTVDLVCHGAPSQMVFDRYIADTYGKENLKSFKFRTKEFGYNCVNQIVYLKDGTSVPGNISFDYYEKCMHSGLAAKAICGDCPFAAAPRQGDITIGDFWGISQHNPSYNDGLGTSVLLVNNATGQKVWDEIKSDCKLAEPVPFAVARKHNRFGSHYNIPAGREKFFHLLKTRPFDVSVDYALNRKFDVGVIGLWYGLNYGSMATYYALHHTLQSLGLSVLMVENALRPDSECVTKTHPRKIADKFYDVSRRYPIPELKTLNQFCDSFIVGSDQLWNVDLSRPYRQTYYLDFVDDNKKRISVATSFGKPYAGTPEERMITKRNLERFDYISVRDTLSKDICRNFGVDATEICDPTLMCTSEIYEPIIELAELEHKEKFLLAYILDPGENTAALLHEMAVYKKCKVYVILDLCPPLWEKRKNILNAEQFPDVEVKAEVDLAEWLWYFKNAEAVVTDSYHGTIFSVLYQKPFVTSINYARGATRFTSLLEPLGLEGRLFDGFGNITSKLQYLDALDYTVANTRLNRIRTDAVDWLRNALYAPKKIKSKAIYPLSCE